VLGAETLTVGVLGDQGLEAPDHVGVAAKRQLGLDQLLERGQAQVIQTRDLGRRDLAQRALP
jgi:hypothetical protein